jgi:hypothetical protein|tara:strand:+ start:992 stop:1207 length:216 start_codon:yes stop_codon:yes gene_type:complete
MSMILLTNLALWVFGFIAGVLVGRKEVETVEKSLEEVLTLYDNAFEDLNDLKAKAKKKERTTTKKPRKTWT